MKQLMQRPVRIGLLAASSLLAAAAALAAPTVEKSVKLDPGLYELAVDSTTGNVYVASTGARDKPGASIIVLDGKTLERKSAIDVTAAPLFGLGLNEKTGKLYGTATRAGSVSVIDVKSGKVLATFKQGENAHVREAIVDPATDRVYITVVGGRGTNTDPSAVWVVDGKTDRIIDTLTLDAKGLTGAAVDPSGQRLFGTAMSANEIVVIDLAQKKIVSRWPAGAESPTNVVYDAASKRLLVANQAGSLSVLDATDGKVLKVVPTGQGALSVALYPEKNQVYVTNRQAGTTTVLDAKDYSVLANLQTGTLPQSVVIDRRNGRVYVTNKARGTPRNQPAGAAPPAEDTGGDTLTLIKP